MQLYLLLILFLFYITAAAFTYKTKQIRNWPQERETPSKVLEQQI